MIKIFLNVYLIQAMVFYIMDNFFPKKAVRFVMKVWQITLVLIVTLEFFILNIKLCCI